MTETCLTSINRGYTEEGIVPSSSFKLQFKEKKHVIER